MEKNNRPSKIILILKLVANDIAATFPYFFAFYVVSLLVSIFSPAWRGYFYWPAFNLSVLFFALISLGSETVKSFWKEVRAISSGEVGQGFEIDDHKAMIVGRGVLFFRKFLAIMVYAVIIPSKEKIISWKGNLRKADYIKLGIIAAVLIFSLFQGIYVVDFFVLLFGLVSVLFVLDMRIAAGCALVFLAACPLLLVFDQSAFAEAAAVYAYYFLIIAVLTGIGDHIKEGRTSLKTE